MLIVSLTSFPDRICTVHKVIESIMAQDFCVDKIILWLATRQFPKKECELPRNLLNLKKRNLTINWCDDLKSYKKLIPTLRTFKTAFVITADDDIIYPSNWVRQLIVQFRMNPHIIWAHRTHKIKIEKNGIASYILWDKEICSKKEGYCIFPTGGAGILYPPNCFFPDILNEDLFMSVAPRADDIWFWAMLILAGNKIATVPNSCMKKLNTIESTQKTVLWKDNVFNNGNDLQLKALLKVYPKIYTLLLKEYKRTLLTKRLMSMSNFTRFLGRKIKSIRNVFSQLKNTLTSYRVDFKNYGSIGNDVRIVGEKCKIFKSAWINNFQGGGASVECCLKKQLLCIYAIGSGNLKISFRGINLNKRGARIPIYVDYISIKINGREMLKKTIIACYDSPFKINFPIKDGEKIICEITTKVHKYSKKDLNAIITTTLDKRSKVFLKLIMKYFRNYLTNSSVKE